MIPPLSITTAERNDEKREREREREREKRRRRRRNGNLENKLGAAEHHNHARTR